MAWLTFATRTSPNAMSTLDTQFSNTVAWSTVACTASGTNVITLTPTLSGYTGPAYANYVKYSFVAVNTTSGATTLKVGALAALNVYQADGTTQVTTGDIVSGQYYEVVYNSALNSAAGGWLIANISKVFPLTVANGGTSLATLTANNVILGNGTSAPGFVAPGTSGNVLTSNGTTWQSTAAAAGTGAAKAWIYFSATGGTYSTTASFNMSGSRSATGTYSFTFSPTLGSANYAVLSQGFGTGLIVFTAPGGTHSTTTLSLLTYQAPAFTAVDVDQGSVVVFGS